MNTFDKEYNAFIEKFAKSAEDYAKTLEGH